MQLTGFVRKSRIRQCPLYTKVINQGSHKNCIREFCMKRGTQFLIAFWTTLIATTKDTHLCDNVYKTAPEKMLVKVTAEQNIWLSKMAK